MASSEFAREAIFAIAGAIPFFLVATFLAWKLLRRGQERANGPRVIAEEVRRYIDEALRSGGFEISWSAGRDAMDGINRCLGPFVEFADGFGGKITQLKIAVAGTIKEDGEGGGHSRRRRCRARQFQRLNGGRNRIGLGIRRRRPGYGDSSGQA